MHYPQASTSQITHFIRWRCLLQLSAPRPRGQMSSFTSALKRGVFVYRWLTVVQEPQWIRTMYNGHVDGGGTRPPTRSGSSMTCLGPRFWKSDARGAGAGELRDKAKTTTKVTGRRRRWGGGVPWEPDIYVAGMSNRVHSCRAYGKAAVPDHTCETAERAACSSKCSDSQDLPVSKTNTQSCLRLELIRWLHLLAPSR